MQALKTITIVTSAAAALSACASIDDANQAPGTAPVSEQPTVQNTTPLATDPAFFVDWTQQPIDRRWYVSNHDLKNGHWESDFRRQNVTALPNGLNISRAAKTPRDGTWPWAGGEIQYRDRPGFGEYQMIMRAASGIGLTTGFFTHTGPYYGTAFDEIDIVISGADPYNVQLNAIAEGVGVGALNYPVEFDTTKNYALYSFTWEPDRITWYINGEYAHHVSSDDVAIPQTAGILFANLYATRAQAGAPPANFQAGATASFRCMSYRPLDDTRSRTCAEAYESYIAGN